MKYSVKIKEKSQHYQMLHRDDVFSSFSELLICLNVKCNKIRKKKNQNKVMKRKRKV